VLTDTLSSASALFNEGGERFMKSRNVTHYPNYDGDQFSTVEDEIENLKAALLAILFAKEAVARTSSADPYCGSQSR
jgi:hypothetical protein